MLKPIFRAVALIATIGAVSTLNAMEISPRQSLDFSDRMLGQEGKQLALDPVMLTELTEGSALQVLESAIQIPANTHRIYFQSGKPVYFMKYVKSHGNVTSGHMPNSDQPYCVIQLSRTDLEKNRMLHTGSILRLVTKAEVHKDSIHLTFMPDSSPSAISCFLPKTDDARRWTVGDFRQVLGQQSIAAYVPRSQQDRDTEGNMISLSSPLKNIKKQELQAELLVE
jgi:hypothetical protein